MYKKVQHISAKGFRNLQDSTKEKNSYLKSNHIYPLYPFSGLLQLLKVID
jgi:hypothetical protein